MAEPKTFTEAANSPGIGMRLTISMIGKKFSGVKQMTTEELSTRLAVIPESGDISGASPAKRNLILLKIIVMSQIGFIDKYNESRPFYDLFKRMQGTRKREMNPNWDLPDCRDEEEYKVSHIKDAVRVNPGDEVENIVKTVDDLKSRGSNDVVCYCSVGYRSSDVAQKLTRYFKSTDSESQHPTCYNLEGSLFKWANEKRPMVNSENQPTPFAHPYNAVFGKLLDSELRKYTT